MPLTEVDSLRQESRELTAILTAMVKKTRHRTAARVLPALVLSVLAIFLAATLLSF
jgi:hypothetical protein